MQDEPQEDRKGAPEQGFAGAEVRNLGEIFVHAQLELHGQHDREPNRGVDQGRAQALAARGTARRMEFPGNSGQIVSDYAAS